jgi:type I restriction-modification system DNA methylase subunit
MSLVKSKQRVADHGEVFTPDWMVQDMLDLVKDESERIESRFLEPACGSGNFLVPTLQRKLITVQTKYGKSDFEKVHYSMLALMSLYGIELLLDNVEECRKNLLSELVQFLKLEDHAEEALAAQKVLTANIVHGDALSMTKGRDGKEPITFPEWAYLGKGKFKRRDFRYDVLTTMSSFGEGTLFEDLNKHEIFFPEKDYPQLSIKDIANG